MPGLGGFDIVFMTLGRPAGAECRPADSPRVRMRRTQSGTLDFHLAGWSEPMIRKSSSDGRSQVSPHEVVAAVKRSPIHLEWGT